VNPVYINDSAPLEANIFAEDQQTPITAASASWEIVRPDGKELIVTSFPPTPVTGERVIVQEGTTIGGIAARHVAEFNGTTWVDLGPPLANFTFSGNTTSYLVPTQATYQEGVYRARAKFILSDGSQRSQFVNFEVLDPLKISTTDIDKTLDVAWMFLEDCFDSENGGPYLRDVTLANFDKKKMALLAPSALFQIGIKPPATTYTVDNFPYTEAGPLLAKAILIESIKHLMRSYTEQPNVLGAGQISYFDRRDYLTRWQSIYQLEMEEFKHWLALWKRGQFNFGSGSLLIDLKSGRRQMYPQLDRARGRYWY
jgi:hypothetical protein